MRVLHLTATGQGRPPASLEFASRLTVVYGASDTGKTYVVDALNFMLGGSTLREIPEAKGYRLMLLGIEFDDGEVATLARDLRGGPFLVYDGDWRDIPDRPPDRKLLGQHSKDNRENISHFLLGRLGIADAKVRKNSRNELQSMSFRNIAHLILVDEERMPSRHSPVETGRSTSQTAERSAFKLLIEGEDDSGLTEGEDLTAFRRVNRGQVDVLDRAIRQIRARLEGAPEHAECLEVQVGIVAAIQEGTTSMAADLQRRKNLVAQQSQLQDEQRLLRDRTSEAAVLLNRFTLLDAQYTADLGRLQLVKEAGTLLGYFTTDSCVFCGAAAEHQRREHAIYETVQLAESVDAETVKTEALKQDLALTLSSVRSELDNMRERITVLDADLHANSDSLAEIDRILRPAQEDLNQLITRRSEIERSIDLWSHLAALEELQSTVAEERPTIADSVARGVSSSTQRAFSRRLHRVLTSWKVPAAKETTFTFTERPEIMVQHRRREDRGKGMRSVLHAGFSVALSEFCMANSLPHPGFVVLDTPVLTYRDADQTSDLDIQRQIVDDELLSGSVAQAFYSYLANTHPGQAIVLENQTPPEVEVANCAVVYFTANSATGRPGFYPTPN